MYNTTEKKYTEFDVAKIVAEAFAKGSRWTMDVSNHRVSTNSKEEFENILKKFFEGKVE